ncbi:hypothetical protein GC169_02705 [bacterium]|nr:hypothetical protein [bacterium]
MFGSKKNPWEDYRVDGGLPEVPRADNPVLRAGGAASIPKKVDLRSQCSPIEDQGRLASCAACAVVGAGEMWLRKQPGGGGFDLSRLFVYFNGRHMANAHERDAGLLTSHAIAAAVGYGACPEAMWPYNINRFQERPPQPCYDRAISFAGVQFANVPRGEAAMRAVASGLPLIFRYFGPKELLDEAGQTGRIPEWTSSDPAIDRGGHTMVIVGYDQDARTALVRNSWGVQWGDRGYCTIPFSTLEACTHEQEFWSLGELQSVPGLVYEGASSASTVQSIVGRASEEFKQSLASLRTETRSTIEQGVEKAKQDIRNRLRGQT